MYPLSIALERAGAAAEAATWEAAAFAAGAGDALRQRGIAAWRAERFADAAALFRRATTTGDPAAPARANLRFNRRERLLDCTAHRAIRGGGVDVGTGYAEKHPHAEARADVPLVTQPHDRLLDALPVVEREQAALDETFDHRTRADVSGLEQKEFHGAHTLTPPV
jgi:hypothetical protein